MKRVVLVLVIAMAALVVPAASAADTHSLFDDAELVSPGNGSPRAVQVRSDATPGWGGVDFVVPAGTTFAAFTSLSTDYMFEADDSCAGGAPRFQINLDSGSGDTGNMFVYIGPPPGFTNCPSAQWVSTGNLLVEGTTIDSSQLDAGAFYDTYDATLTKYGAYTVTGVQFVVDAGWAFPDDLEQSVLIDNTNVGGVLYTFETSSDLVGQLQGDTAALVDHVWVERTLLASLAQAQRSLDNGNPRVASLAIYQYLVKVQVYEFIGIISPDAADQLTQEAQLILTSLN